MLSKLAEKWRDLEERVAEVEEVRSDLGRAELTFCYCAALPSPSQASTDVAPHHSSRRLGCRLLVDDS